LISDFVSLEYIKSVKSESITFTSGSPSEKFKGVNLTSDNISILTNDIHDFILSDNSVLLNNNAYISGKSMLVVENADVKVYIEKNESLLRTTFKLNGSLTINGSEVRQPEKLIISPFESNRENARRSLDDTSSAQDSGVSVFLYIPAILVVEKDTVLTTDYGSISKMIVSDGEESYINECYLKINLDGIEGIEFSDGSIKFYNSDSSCSLNLNMINSDLTLKTTVSETNSLNIVFNEGFTSNERCDLYIAGSGVVNCTNKGTELTNFTIHSNQNVKLEGDTKGVINQIENLDPLTPDEPKDNGINVGAIVGGVVGGVVVIVAIVVFIIFYVNHPREATDSSSGSLDEILNIKKQSKQKNIRKHKFAKEGEYKTDDTSNFNGGFWVG